jgi:hypothetical protein
MKLKQYFEDRGCLIGALMIIGVAMIIIVSAAGLLSLIW